MNTFAKLLVIAIIAGLILWNLTLECRHRELVRIVVATSDLQMKMNSCQLAGLNLIEKLVDADSIRYEEVKYTGIRLAALEQQQMDGSRKTIKAIGGN